MSAKGSSKGSRPSAADAVAAAPSDEPKAPAAAAAPDAAAQPAAKGTSSAAPAQAKGSSSGAQAKGSSSGAKASSKGSSSSSSSAAAAAAAAEDVALSPLKTPFTSAPAASPGKAEVPGMDVFEFGEIRKSAHEVVNAIVASSLKGKTYDQYSVNDWSDLITQKVVDGLRGLSPNFKYVASCMLVQAKGAGLHGCTLAHWDGRDDGGVEVRWSNRTIVAYVTAFGLAQSNS